jgi:hypothetical protein
LRRPTALKLTAKAWAVKALGTGLDASIGKGAQLVRMDENNKF